MKQPAPHDRESRSVAPLGMTVSAERTTLTRRALTLRNDCVAALARASSHPAPRDADLGTLPNDFTLREAWTWWSMRNSPPWVEQQASAGAARKRRTWLDAAVVLVATAALLLIRAAPLGG